MNSNIDNPRIDERVYTEVLVYRLVGNVLICEPLNTRIEC